MNIQTLRAEQIDGEQRNSDRHLAELNRRNNRAIAKLPWQMSDIARRERRRQDSISDQL